MIDDLFQTLGEVLSRKGLEDTKKEPLTYEHTETLTYRYTKIWVHEDGSTWTAVEPHEIYVTEEQLEILKSGEGADDLMEALLEDQAGSE